MEPPVSLNPVGWHTARIFANAVSVVLVRESIHKGISMPHILVIEDDLNISYLELDS